MKPIEAGSAIAICENRNESTSSTHFCVFEGSNVTLLRHIMNVKPPCA